MRRIVDLVASPARAVARAATAYRGPSSLGVLTAVLLAVLLAAGAAQGAFWFSERPMPEFRNQSAAAWINTEPLTREQLKGQVVLIEVWTSI